MQYLDEANDAELLWTTRQVGKLYANLQIVEGNGIEIDERTCRKLARGKKNDIVRQIEEILPLHYKHIDEVLDDVFEQKRSYPASDAEPSEDGVPPTEGSGSGAGGADTSTGDLFGSGGECGDIVKVGDDGT